MSKWQRFEVFSLFMTWLNIVSAVSVQCMLQAGTRWVDVWLRKVFFSSSARFQNTPSIIRIWIKFIVFHVSFFQRRRQYANKWEGILKSLPSLYWSYIQYKRKLISVLFLFSTQRVLKIDLTRFNLLTTKYWHSHYSRTSSWRRPLSHLFIALCVVSFVSLIRN